MDTIEQWEDDVIATYDSSIVYGLLDRANNYERRLESLDDQLDSVMFWLPRTERWKAEGRIRGAIRRAHNNYRDCLHAIDAYIASFRV